MATDAEYNLLAWIPVYKRGAPTVFHVRQHCMERERDPAAADRLTMVLHDLVKVAVDQGLQLCRRCAANDPTYWHTRHIGGSGQGRDDQWDADESIEFLARHYRSLLRPAARRAIQRRRPDLPV